MCDDFVDTLCRDTQEVPPSRTVFRSISGLALFSVIRYTFLALICSVFSSQIFNECLKAFKKATVRHRNVPRVHPREYLSRLQVSLKKQTV